MENQTVVVHGLLVIRSIRSSYQVWKHDKVIQYWKNPFEKKLVFHESWILIIYNAVTFVAAFIFAWRKLRWKRDFETKVFICLFLYVRIILPTIDLSSSVYLWFDYCTNPNIGASGGLVSTILLAFSLGSTACLNCYAKFSIVSPHTACWNWCATCANAIVSLWVL